MSGAPSQFSAGVDGCPPQPPQAEREAPAALPPLQLRAEQPASTPAPAPGSASSSLTSSLLLHRSSSLPHSPALPEPRPVFQAEPPPQQQLLYHTEVRSCGHHTPLYVKVPVNSADAAPVPPPSLTSVAAAAPPLAPATAAGSGGLAPRVATRRVPPPPPPPPAPYAAESARASVRSEALPPHGSDGGRTPASPAPSTVLAASPHAAARVVAVDEHRDGSDSDVESAASSPDVRAGETAAPPAEGRDAAHVLLLDSHPAVRPFAFLYAATTTSATSSVERQQLSDTEDERDVDVDVDVNPDTAAAEAAAPAPPGAEGTAGYQDRLSPPLAAPQISSDSLHTSLVELTMESGTHTAALAAAAAAAAATTDSLPDPPFSAIEHATTTAEDADTANTDCRTRSRDSTPAERPAEEDAGAASGQHAKPAATAPTTAAAVSAQSDSAQRPTSAVEAAGDGDDASDVCSLHDSEAAALLLGVPADVAPTPPSDTRRSSSGDAGQQARVPLAPPPPEPAIAEAGASGGQAAASSRALSGAFSVTSFHVVEEWPGEVPASTLDAALAAPALTVVPATAADDAEPPHDVEVLASAEEDMEDDAVDWAVERDAEAAPMPQLVTPPAPAAHPVYGGDVVSGVSTTNGTVSPVMLAEQTRVSSDVPAARDSLAAASTAAHTGHRDVPPTHLQHRTPVPPASAEGSPAAPAATHYPPADVDDVAEVSEVDEVEQDSVPPVNTADALHQQREEETGVASVPLPAPSAADPWRPVPVASAWDTETAAQVEPVYASRAGVWRWPPSNRGVPSVSQTRLPVAWASSGAAALFRQRPVARDLMADVDVSDDDGARGRADAEPQQEPQQEAEEDTTVCSPWSPEAAGPTPATRAHAAAVDRLVQAHRRVVASAPLDELMALEQDGRRQMMYAMLQDRQAVLHEEAAAYAVVTLPRMPPPPAASAGARTRVEEAEEAGMLGAHAAWVPPLPPSPLGPSHQLLHGAARSSQSAAAALLATFTPPPPTSRAEVERLLRTRGVSSGASLGFVSAALFADELLRREVVEDAEAGARAMLHCLCQCDADAMNPYSLVVQEALARQRLMAAEQLDRERTRSLENSPAADVSELMSIGRELAMCRIMEEDERHEVIEKAEAQGRQRLRELHWRGLAARLRQRELTWASMDVALRSALDDVVFDETQAREEVRVEAIRALTELLESASGAAVRHAQQRQRVQQQHPPKQLTANMTSIAKDSERRDAAAAAAAAAETEVTHATVQAQWPTQKRSAVVACDHTAPAAGQHAAEEEVDWELVEDVVEELDDIIATPDAPVLEAAPANGASSPSVSSSVSLSATPRERPLARPTDAVASATTSAGAAAAAAAAAATLAAAATFATVAAAHSGSNSAGPDMQRFFEWDPTSNSASLQRPPRPSEDSNAAHVPHSSASSPSPHLTNMTVMTTTGNTTANTTGTTTKTTTATTTTTTTSSSRNAAGRVGTTHDTTAAAPAPSVNAAAVAVAVTSSSESRRSPTTLLQSHCEDQQHKGVSSAELSALMNALRTSEATVTAARHAARSSGAPTTQQQSADPRAAAVLADAGAREGADEDSPREEQVETHMRPSAPRVKSTDDVADVSATATSSPSASPPPPVRPTATAAAVKSARVVNRHTVPCSLCRSPGLGYAALLRRYAPEQLDQSPLPSLASPLSPSSSCGRHYADSDVYAYDALHTRHAGPPTRPTALGPLPWERLQVLDGLYVAGDDVNAVAVHAGDTTAGAATAAAAAAPGVVSPSEPSLVTPARAIFPDLRRPWSSTRRRTSPFTSSIDADRPAAARGPPLQQQQPFVLEVVTARRSAGASSALRASSSGGVVDDVTVSPMSSALRESRSRSESPSHTHPAVAWAAAHLHEEPLARGALMHTHAHRDESDAVGGAREHQLPRRPHNPDQSGCSRRRWDTATSAGTSAPLLITRLPLECGPGVWMSASSDSGRRGVRHVLATTTPPRTRPPPATLSGAVAEAARAGDAVVRLPTTVAELLGVPQHTRLPLGDAEGDLVDVNREQRRRGGAAAAVRPHASPYNYVDVFYRNKTPIASTVHPQPSRSTPARSPPSKTHDTAAAFVAARCSAVERREVVHELRQVLRAPTPSTSPRGHRLECSASQRDPQSQRRRASHASSASTAVLAADPATPTKGDIGDDVAEAEECCFDAYDDATAVLRSVAAVTHAGRQWRRHSRASTVMSPAPSPALPPPPRVTRRASGSADVARPRRASALTAPPPPSLPPTPSRDAERLATSHRALPAPSPSFELTPHSPRRLNRSALSNSSAAAVATAAGSSSTARSSLAHSPSTVVVAAVIASRWGGAAAAAASPTRTQPLRQWHPLGQGRVPSPRRRAAGSISATDAAPMPYVTFV